MLLFEYNIPLDSRAGRDNVSPDLHASEKRVRKAKRNSNSKFNEPESGNPVPASNQAQGNIELILSLITVNKKQPSNESSSLSFGCWDYSEVD